MELVIDAQIIGWFYQSTERSKGTPCTGSPEELMSRLGSQDIAVLDAGKQIEREWRAKADPEWFDAWLAERFSVGDIIEASVGTHGELIRRLRSECGFPQGGGDKWYVRTAKTRTDADSKVCIVSEDLDFFHPKAKGGAGNRDEILAKCKGCVVKILKSENVKTASVAAYLASG